MNADGSNMTRLTYTGDNETSPAFSYDGSKIVFMKSSNVYIMNADGSNIKQITFDGVSKSYPCFAGKPR